MNAGAAQTWFIAGTIPLILAGGLHALGALIDTVRPTFFAPIDGSAKPVVEGTGVRLVRMVGGSGARPSMWRMWLGINISHGLGVFTFGLLCLLIATQDFELVKRIDALRPLTIAFPAAYFVISLRYWFYGPVLVTATATACFTVAAVLSA
ncbi:MAG TPA: hypothetical protein VE972_00875 [Conexibacter sp.]|nr:hypothetical protein [Conexibacter sp.]